MTPIEVVAAARKKKLARGLAINNPLNVFWYAKNKWQGQEPARRDGRLEAFISPQMGIRAAVKILFKYRDRGLDTLEEIIREWAPPIENETEKYIETVSKRIGIGRATPIDIDDCRLMLALVKAMGRVEQGIELPYSDDTILEGLRAGGIYNVKPPPVARTPEGKGGTVATIGALSTATVAVIDQAQNVLMDAPWIGGLAQWVIAYQPKLVATFAVVVMLGVGYAVFARWRKTQKGLA